jgi:hypothetical protein
LIVPVQRRVFKRRTETRPELYQALIDDRPLEGIAAFVVTEDEIREAWERHGEFILAAWVRKHPGTRPSYWWEFNAPRQPVGRFPGWYYDGKLPEPRRRLGGVGTPKHEVLAYVPRYEFGVPASWTNRWEVKLYGGRVRGNDGKPLFKKGDFKGVVPDGADPPVFESQANYLKRHNLLLPGEAPRLTPRDFEPEVLEVYVFGEDENPYRPAPRCDRHWGLI